MNEAHPERTDEELVKLVQKGDKEQFAPLVQRYEKKLFRYGKKFLSSRENIQDMVQDVFIKTYQSINSFDTTQRFSPWIYRIAHNTFVNALKKNIRDPLHIFDFDTLVSHPVYEDTTKLEKDQKEMRIMIEKGLDKLSAGYKEIIILYYLEELSYQEIADVLRVPIGTVGVRLKRAKEALKKVYKELDMTYDRQ